MRFGRTLVLFAIVIAFGASGGDALATCSYYDCDTESSPPMCQEYLFGDPPEGSYYVSDCRVYRQCMPTGDGEESCYENCKFTFCYTV